MQTDLKTPFRWYDNPAKKNRNKSSCERECPYRLYMPLDRLHPFIFRVIQDVTTIGGVPTEWKIWTMNDAMEEDISAYVNHIFVGRSNGYEYYIYSATAPIPVLNLAEGFYYSTIKTTNGGTITSEDFYIDPSPNKRYAKLIWWNPSNMGGILYNQNNYKNELWLDVDTIVDDPQIEEEGFETGNKRFIQSFARYIENKSIQDLVPAYIARALAAVSLHKEIYLIEPGDTERRKVINFKAQTAFDVEGCLGVVTANFQYDEEEIISTGCGEDDLPMVVNAAFAPGTLSNVVATPSAEHVVISWTYATGTTSGVEIQSPSLNGGLPVKVNSPGTSLSIDLARGTYTAEVRPFRNVGPVSSYGDPVPLTFTIS